MGTKEGNGREGRVKSKCDGDALTALGCSTGSSGVGTDFQGCSELG